MSLSLIKLTGAVAVSAGLAWAGAAWAEPQDPGAPTAMAPGAGYTADDAPLGAATELRIDLRGRVAARCEVTPPQDLGRILLNDAGEARGAFGIDCNTPFLLRVRSENGGMAAVQDLAGIAPKADYSLGVELGASDGRHDLGWCASADLAPDAAGTCAFGGSGAQAGWSSGEAIAIRQSGALRLRWDGQGQGAPRLGAYQDNIVIEVEVRS